MNEPKTSGVFWPKLVVALLLLNLGCLVYLIRREPAAPLPPPVEAMPEDSSALVEEAPLRPVVTPPRRPPGGSTASVPRPPAPPPPRPRPLPAETAVVAADPPPPEPAAAEPVPAAAGVGVAYAPAAWAGSGSNQNLIRYEGQATGSKVRMEGD